MKKRVVLISIALAVLSGILWGWLHWYANREIYSPPDTDEKMARDWTRVHGDSPTQPPLVPQTVLPASRPVRLGIGGLGLPDDESNRRLSDLLTARLGGVSGLELVERVALDQVLRELQLTLSGLVRAKDAVRVGKLLRADWFLLGSAATIQGTNVVVVRVVDARSGILRDGALLVQQPEAGGMAEKLGDFVAQCRRDASSPRPRVYLALGAFEDVGLNNRQASFPNQLRAYLTAAYQRANVTLLEREAVSTLLQEVQLDLAGLTEEGATNASTQMQSAFWLVRGTYQSYETTGHEVELELHLARMFGRSKRFPFRDQPGEGLFGKVKQTIDSALANPWYAGVPSRNNEVRAQMAAGRDLAHLSDFEVIWVASYNEVDPAQAGRERRNREEAIRAFQSVLLLDPDNQEARVCLAACLRHRTVLRLEEARTQYRQVLESPMQDKWTDIAQKALLNSLRFEYGANRVAWFEQALREAPDSPAAPFYRRCLAAARDDAVIQAADRPEARQLAETRLFAALQRWQREVAGHGYTVDFYNSGFGIFVESFGTNKVAAGKRMAELLPELQEAFPTLAPHILAGVVSCQVDTNAPVIAQFERELERISQHPEQVPEARFFFRLISGPLCYWSTARKLHALTAKMLEARAKAAAQKQADELDDERKMAQAFAYLATERWRPALEVFQTWSNRPVYMGNGGLWGKAFTPVFTRHEADLCRQKLGLPFQADPREFKLPPPCWHLQGPTAFAADADGLWLAIDGRLLRLDSNLKTNLDLALPLDLATPLNCLAATATSVWISTGGAGLIEFDKTTHRFAQLTEAEGLFMNFVTDLCPTRDTLWLGYGSHTGGGLGKFDLRTRKATSFGNSLFPDPQNQPAAKTVPAARGTPARKRVDGVGLGANGDVWLSEQGGLRRFRPDQGVWEDVSQPGMCCVLALNQARLFVGYRTYSAYGDNRSGLLGVNVLNLGEGSWRPLKAIDGLPHQMVSTVAIAGANLWVGGMGFVALVDPDRGLALRYAYVGATGIDRIQVGGDTAWIQFAGHLYRVDQQELLGHGP